MEIEGALTKDFVLDDSVANAGHGDGGAIHESVFRQRRVTTRSPAVGPPFQAFEGLVGSSAEMRRLFRRIDAVAATCSNVLIVGETGTGKELIARAVHRRTAPQTPFVPFNCAAITKDLVESELFGHRRGAFSGATTEHPGLLRAAESGTVFLDEITEMGLDIQAKLLRAIQERAVRPVGSIYEIPINVRIVASTNRNPAEATRTGHLRTDLYYRLETNVLEVVPLRDRVDDVELLALHFLSQLNERNSASRFVATIASDALSALKAYGWPGNVRELNNAIESAFTFGSSPAITLDDLPARIKSAWRLSTWESISSERSSLKTAARGLEPEVRSTYADFERESIAKALLNAGGNKAQAARILKISRKKLYNRITRYGLQVRLIVGSQLAAAQQS